MVAKPTKINYWVLKKFRSAVQQYKYARFSNTKFQNETTQTDIYTQTQKPNIYKQIGTKVAVRTRI